MSKPTRRRRLAVGLEAGRIDDAVDLVLLAVGHDALLADAVDAL
jgi:hypothetical protein